MATLLDIGAFLAAFAGVTLGVGASFPSAQACSRGAVKLERYEQDAARSDLVFLGSSRTFRAVDPALFDTGCGRPGLDTGSFNFGGHGALGLDIVHSLAEFSALAEELRR